MPARKTRASTKIRVAKPIVLQPETQTFVTVTTECGGLITVDPIKKLFDTSMCLVGAGIAQVEPNKEYRILIANMGKDPRTLTIGQTVATAGEHPTQVTEAPFNHGEVLGIAVENLYRKRPLDVKAEEVINASLAKNREQAFGETEKEPITAETVPLDVDEKHHPAIRRMLKKHESMWSGKLGHINVTTHRIDLIPGTRPFKSAPYRAGPKTRELEQSEINKQLAAGVIEPAYSAWESPVLFVPKKDCKLRFCIDYRRLNSVTVKDSYPIPRMDECIDSLGKAQVFSALDAFSGYWQIPIRPEDRHKTAFTCHAGTF